MSFCNYFLCSNPAILFDFLKFYFKWVTHRYNLRSSNPTIDETIFYVDDLRCETFSLHQNILITWTQNTVKLLQVFKVFKMQKLCTSSKANEILFIWKMCARTCPSSPSLVVWLSVWRSMQFRVSTISHFKWNYVNLLPSKVLFIAQ